MKGTLLQCLHIALLCVTMYLHTREQNGNLYYPYYTLLADWVKEDDSSDLDGGDSVPGDEETESCDVEITGLTREDTTVLPRPGLSRERTGFSRERTAISLADFYAPSPSPTQHGKYRA